MNSRLWIAALSLAAFVSAPAAFAQTSVRFSIGNAPPPPRVYFRHSPRWDMVPDSRVYVVNDYDNPGYDMFRYGGYFYMYNDGYWYRASSYRGPFIAVREDYVPAAIWDVPRDQWRHGYPTRNTHYDRGYHRGWRNRDMRDRNRDRYRDRDRYRSDDPYRDDDHN